MNTKENKLLEPLEHIKKVAPPPLLYDQIAQRIAEESMVKPNAKWLVAASVTLLVLIASNSFLLRSKFSTQATNSKNLIETFQLTNNNHIYYE